MMKKKVKKIPKYNTGAINAGGFQYDPNMFKTNVLQAPSILNSNAAQGFNQVANNVNSTIALQNPTLYNQALFNQTVSQGLTDPVQQNQQNMRGLIGSVGTGAGVGAMVGGIPGALIGGGIGFLSDALPKVIGNKGHVSEATGEITDPSGIAGVFGPSKSSLMRKSNRIKNAILAKQQTENVKADYYNNVNVPDSVNILAAEGGVMRQPVDALVSKGELIYNPVTKKLSQVPGSKGKPNKADDVYAKLYEGDVVISNSPTMLMANGKTPAQNLMGMVDKYATGGTVKAREAIIKKVVNWQEANKTKPQEYATYDEGTGETGITKFIEKSRKRGAIIAQTEVDGKTYVKLGDGNWYDTVNGKVGKRTIKTSKLRKAFATADAEFQQNAAESVTKTKDITIPNGGYTQNWESDVLKTPIAQSLFGQNKRYNLFEPLDIVERAGYNYGSSHGEYNSDLNLYDFSNSLPVLSAYKTIRRKPDSTTNNVPGTIGDTSKAVLYDYEIPNLSKDAIVPKTLNTLPIERTIGLMDTYDEDIDSAYKSLRNRKNIQKLSKLGNKISGYLPLIGAVLNKPKYHTEETIISPANYISTGVNTDPIRRSIDETYNIGNYNFANMGESTGKRMAYGIKLASNRAKQLADMYQWQQEQQNKLIAQNVGIRNDWGKRYDAAKYQAIADTRANEAAADAQYAVNKRDAFKYLRDRQLLPLYKQYLRSGAYNDNIENLS